MSVYQLMTDYFLVYWSRTIASRPKGRVTLFQITRPAIEHHKSLDSVRPTSNIGSHYFRQACGHLPSQGTSLPFGQYQIQLLDLMKLCAI